MINGFNLPLCPQTQARLDSVEIGVARLTLKLLEDQFFGFAILIAIKQLLNSLKTRVRCFVGRFFQKDPLGGFAPEVFFERLASSSNAEHLFS